jgi:hypothetical protein
VTGNYTFSVTVDDVAAVDIDGEVLLARGGSRRAVVWLELGYHDVVVHYLEVTGSANLRLTWDAGVANAVSQIGRSASGAACADSVSQPNAISCHICCCHVIYLLHVFMNTSCVCTHMQALVTIPTGNIYLTRPGHAVPVQAIINGAPARLACDSLTIPVTATPAAVLDPQEPRRLSAVAPECGYFASSWLTPVITSTAVIPGPGGSMGAGSILQVNGSLLTNSSSDVTVMIGDVQCEVLSVLEDGSSASCLMPDLTAGTAHVTVTVAGAGAATMPTGGAVLLLVIPLSVGRTVLPARVSFLGGVEVTLNGSGFGVVSANSSSNDSACGASVRCRNTSMSVSMSGATPGPVEPVLVSSTFTAATIRLPRFVATSTAASFQLNLQLRVFDRASDTTISTATVPVTLERTFAPTVSTVSPRVLQPYTAGNITLSWAVPAAAAAAAGLLNATDAGAASVASVALQAVRSTRRVTCGAALVLSSNLTSSQYLETVSCAVDADMPAAMYGLWVCLPAVGCGHFAAAWQVDVTVAGISAVAGSTAGGTKLTITGTGGLQLLHQLLPNPHISRIQSCSC